MAKFKISYRMNTRDGVVPHSDMLRYDCAKVVEKLDEGVFVIECDKATVDRWKSFSWDCKPYEAPLDKDGQFKTLLEVHDNLCRIMVGVGNDRIHDRSYIHYDEVEQWLHEIAKVLRGIQTKKMEEPMYHTLVQSRTQQFIGVGNNTETVTERHIISEKDIVTLGCIVGDNVVSAGEVGGSFGPLLIWHGMKDIENPTNDIISEEGFWRRVKSEAEQKNYDELANNYEVQ